MGFDGKIIAKGLKVLEGKKSDHSREILRHKAEVYAKLPELKELDDEIRLAVSSVMLAALERNEDLEDSVARLRERNLSLQERRRLLLAQNGYATDYYDDKPMCEDCGDAGYSSGKMCHCLHELCSDEQRKELSALLKLGSESFDGFSFDYYSDLPDPVERISPREAIQYAYDISVGYARKFGERSPSLLFSGKPGLGKTFLAACIAKVVSERGFSVVYDTSISVLEGFELVKFKANIDAEAASRVERYLNCDLLILDDLGTEMRTQFTTSALYMLINNRLLANKKTIITTNLTESEIKSTYSPQISSRLLGEYDVCKFLGVDIRVQRRAMF